MMTSWHDPVVLVAIVSASVAFITMLCGIISNVKQNKDNKSHSMLVEQQIKDISDIAESAINQAVALNKIEKNILTVADSIISAQGKGKNSIEETSIELAKIEMDIAFRNETKIKELSKNIDFQWGYSESEPMNPVMWLGMKNAVSFIINNHDLFDSETIEPAKKVLEMLDNVYPQIKCPKNAQTIREIDDYRKHLLVRVFPQASCEVYTIINKLRQKLQIQQ